MIMNSVFDVIVVGGGVSGMSTAWKIGQTGRKVLLLEQGQLGKEASHAAAGMLGAQLEVAQDGPFYRICVESRELYPAFAEELIEETRIDIGLSHNGILQLAQSDEEVESLQARARWQHEAGHATQWFSSDDVARLEPALASTRGALLLPKDGNVCAPALTQALEVAVYRRVNVMQGVQVHDILPRSHDVDVISSAGTFVGSQVVITAGAWAGRLIEAAGFSFPIYPVKGQMLKIRPQQGLGIAHTVFSDHAYLVPKKDGSILVGATEDHHAGFDKTVTAAAIYALLANLKRIAPQLATSTFEQGWSGLRPGSPSGLPLLGPLPEARNVWLAAGHFRNGILLAPVTAKMMLAGLEGASGSEDWNTFLPERLTERY